MTLDLSPKMLQLFLHGRVTRAGVEAALLAPDNRRSGEKAERRRLTRAAKVSSEEFDQAWDAKLKLAAPRVRLWAALGVVPGDHGLTLTDKGGQEVAADTGGAAI